MPILLSADTALPYRSCTIQTIAGNSSPGDGNNALLALLSQTEGIVVDQAGNIYVADAGDNRVRKITPAGAIQTVVGNGIPGFSGDGGPASRRAVKPSIWTGDGPHRQSVHRRSGQRPCPQSGRARANQHGSGRRCNGTRNWRPRQPARSSLRPAIWPWMRMEPCISPISARTWCCGFRRREH